MASPTDPAALFRELLSQWEQTANRVGGEMIKSEPFVQAMHGATGAAAQQQQATHEAMARWLAALNMPSRAEFADLSGRLARIEEALARIEAAVAPLAGSSPARPRPARTRTAPPPRPKAS